jgi:lipopolysaccharide export system permease protein
MNLISRYILKSHIAPFIFGFATVVFLFLMQFLMKYLDELLGKGLSEWVIFQLIIYNIAWMLILAFPMGSLFATLMSFGSMSASHEVTVVKASGGSLIKMMRPVLVAGVLLSVFAFWFNDVILPESNHRAKTLMLDVKKKKPTFSIESGRFATEIDGYTIFPRRVDSVSGMMYGITIYDQRTVVSKNIISADSGFVAFTDDYENLVLKLFHGEIHRFKSNETKDYRIVDFEDYRIALSARGFNFERTDKELVSKGDRELKIEEMQIIVQNAKDRQSELDSNLTDWLQKHYDYITGKNDEFYKSSSRGKYTLLDSADEIPLSTTYDQVSKRLSFFNSTIKSDVTQYAYQDKNIQKYGVEIHKKYAIPIACFLFILVGAPLGIMTRGGNFGISAGISLVFYLFYWAALISGEKLADRGILNPALSMWAGNIIIAVLGILLTLRVNYETLSIFNPVNLFRKKK